MNVHARGPDPPLVGLFLDPGRYEYAQSAWSQFADNEVGQLWADYNDNPGMFAP